MYSQSTPPHQPHLTRSSLEELECSSAKSQLTTLFDIERYIEYLADMSNFNYNSQLVQYIASELGSADSIRTRSPNTIKLKNLTMHPQVLLFQHLVMP